MGSPSGLAIALPVRSVDSIQPFDPTTISEGADRVDGAHDGKKPSGAGCSDAVKIRAHSFDKL